MQSTKITVALVVGSRPEIIKLSGLIQVDCNDESISVIIVLVNITPMK